MACNLRPELIEKVVAFHGHLCPGVYIGIRAAELALERLGKRDEKALVCVAEAEMCGVDAVQFLTVCTCGKGNLVVRDLGKMAFTFYDRNTKEGFRARLRPELQIKLGGELKPLMKKASGAQATEEDRQRAQHLRRKMQDFFLSAGFDELFIITAAAEVPAAGERILPSVTCEACDEPVMEHRIHSCGGRLLCEDCVPRSAG